MKSWKKRWEKEIDNAVPKLNDSVLNAPIPTNNDEVVLNGGNTAVKSRNNRIIVITALALAMLCALVACLTILLPKQADMFLFEVEINPAISVVTDDDGKVTSVMASNADADVILSSQGVLDNMLNKDFSSAVEYYADYAAKLGYLDMNADFSAMRISGCAKDDDILQNAKSALETHFADKGIVVAVLCESVSKEEFCERSGIGGETVKDIAEYIENNNTLYADRLAQTSTVDDLKTLYSNVLVDSQMFDLIKGALAENVETLEKTLANMGIDISIEELLNDFTQDTLVQWGDTISKLMSIADMVPSDIAKLLSIPETVDDYCTQVLSLVKNEFEYRLGKYEEIYNQIRQPITNEDFNSQIDAIITEFGSLSQYWESVKTH